jgi:hypothetical protein
VVVNQVDDAVAAPVDPGRPPRRAGDQVHQQLAVDAVLGGDPGRARDHDVGREVRVGVADRQADPVDRARLVLGECKRAGARAEPVHQPAVPVADRQGLGHHERLDTGVHEPAHRNRHAHRVLVRQQLGDVASEPAVIAAVLVRRANI